MANVLILTDDLNKAKHFGSLNFTSQHEIVVTPDSEIVGDEDKTTFIIDCKHEELSLLKGRYLSEEARIKWYKTVTFYQPTGIVPKYFGLLREPRIFMVCVLIQGEEYSFTLP